jgi:pyrimidine-nucleoside phosphorylase/thymidine phosphorylase
VPSWIAEKRDGRALPERDLERFVAAAAAGLVPDYQVAAMLMAILFQGFSPTELAAWTRAMIASGDRLSFEDVPGPKVDKHSTGGVGDKITLCLAPLVAACGVYAPMLVGRALGHTGGTLDKLEAVSGYRAELPPATFKRVLRSAGFVIAGQSPRIVPADRLFYALRDATATVESIPLIASSILSKKVAGGADALVMDVKAGRGAFLPALDRTRALARTIVDLGRQLGLRTIALLTAMDEPLGRQVGNALEVEEAISVLRGDGPADTRALTVRLGAEMLVVAGAARDLRAGAARIEGAIASGAGYERFVRGISMQGGDARLLERPERLPRARRRLVLRAARSGYLDLVDARLVGQAATLLGAGRTKKEDAVDPAVGLTLEDGMVGGARVRAGEPLAVVWYNDPARLAAARELLAAAFRVVGKPPRRSPLVLEKLS